MSIRKILTPGVETLTERLFRRARGAEKMPDLLRVETPDGYLHYEACDDSETEWFEFDLAEGQIDTLIAEFDAATLDIPPTRKPRKAKGEPMTFEALMAYLASGATFTITKDADGVHVVERAS